MNPESRPQNEAGIWDKLASSYDRDVLRTYQDAYRLTQDAILEDLNPHAHVLEVGCGTGIVSLSIAPHAGEVVGVDLSPKMVALAQAKAENENRQNLTFRQADAYELPFDDESFDMVLLTNLLHVVAEPSKVIKEAQRVLRPEGILASVTDCMAEPAPFRVWVQTLGLRILKRLGAIKYFHFYHKSDLENLFTAHGLKITKRADMHPAPVNYYLAGVKKG